MKKIAKRVLAGAVAFSVICSPIASFAGTYRVQSGDSYWKISQKFDVNLQELLEVNNTNGNTTLQVGQEIIIPEDYYFYTVQSGDTLWIISQKFQVSLHDVLSLNNLNQSSYIYVGQRLKIPSNKSTEGEKATDSSIYDYYTVKSGDTLWIISQKLGIVLDKLMALNNLNSKSIIYIGQKLKITSNNQASPGQGIPDQPSVEVVYIDHKVEKGDNFWSISTKYGVQVNEVLKANNATTSTTLSIGDIVKVPQYRVGVMETLGEEYGEYLDWWNAAQYVLPIGAEFKVIDFYTGKSFMAKRTTGANHADTETLTTKDTNIMKEIWGGKLSWLTRPVIIEYKGRRIAASVASMPHAGNDSAPGGEYTSWRSDNYGAGTNFDYVKGNGMDGHFDIHFLNSSRHKDGQIDERHQKNVKIAAGITK